MVKDIMEGFAAFVAGKWEGGFSHSYRITSHRSWNSWRNTGRENAPDEWHCNSISQAADHYSWSGPDAAAEYQDLSVRLQTAVQNKNDNAARDLCFDIFKWGGVWKGGKTGSVLWINQQLEKVGICGQLLEACDLLTDMNADLNCFNGNKLLMNSSMTKVYAALAPSRLVIYDGRVGAALGLLAKDYLRSTHHHGAMPLALKFPWGASQGSQVRNPSDADFHFPPLFGYQKDKLHAEMMRNTSCLLGKVAAMISPSSPYDLPRLEKALFMIGYDVSRQELQTV